MHTIAKTVAGTIKKFLFLLLGALFLSACGVVARQNQGFGPMMGGDWQLNRQYETNCEQIYFTATNSSGERIPYSGGSSFGGMMGAGPLACSSCHGPDARGGVHTMHMDVMDAPDIRFSALSGESDEHGDTNHADEHDGYDLDDFRRAVVEGMHPDGDELSPVMPRWQIDDDDLVDLFEYLKSLP
jgi:hypothetical protein